MKRLLTVLFAILTTTVAMAQFSKTDVEFDAQFFTDPSCTELKADVKNTKTFKSVIMKHVAHGLLSENYNSRYIVGEYEAYPSPQVLMETLKLGDGFSKYENITGVYLESGRHFIFVGNTGGKKIKLLLPNWMRQPPRGVKPTEDPRGWGLYKQEIELKEGLNVVFVNLSTNAYISYFDNNYATAPKIKVHFPTGKGIGYFDASIHTDKDWNRLINYAEEQKCPIIDARGKYIQVAYPLEWLKRYAYGKGVELINAYDTMVGLQYKIMGLEKYNRIPKNRVLARVNYNYYMFRDRDGVAYLGDKGTMRMVCDPAVVTKGDPCWGFSHEVGHVMQMRPITWGGMTEVSNNIFSLYVNITLGTPSRIANQNNYDKARESIIGKNISYLHDNDPFNRLVPFWQLHLYFTENGHPDFYADVMEEMRKIDKVPVGNESIKSQFTFMKICCDVTKTDLTDFFEKWGFFWTGQISLKDYADYNFNITKEMVDETKAYIASKKYNKPTVDITTVRDK